MKVCSWSSLVPIQSRIHCWWGIGIFSTSLTYSRGWSLNCSPSGQIFKLHHVSKTWKPCRSWQPQSKNLCVTSLLAYPWRASCPLQEPSYLVGRFLLARRLAWQYCTSTNPRISSKMLSSSMPIDGSRKMQRLSSSGSYPLVEDHGCVLASTSHGVNYILRLLQWFVGSTWFSMARLRKIWSGENASLLITRDDICMLGAYRLKPKMRHRRVRGFGRMFVARFNAVPYGALVLLQFYLMSWIHHTLIETHDVPMRHWSRLSGVILCATMMIFVAQNVTNSCLA